MKAALLLFAAMLLALPASAAQAKKGIIAEGGDPD